MLHTNQAIQYMKGFDQCPMCGGIRLRIESHYIADVCYVTCKMCGLNLPLDIEALPGESEVDFHNRCLEVARRKWNKRATEGNNNVESNL